MQRSAALPAIVTFVLLSPPLSLKARQNQTAKDACRQSDLLACSLNMLESIVVPVAPLSGTKYVTLVSLFLLASLYGCILRHVWTNFLSHVSVYSDLDSRCSINSDNHLLNVMLLGVHVGNVIS